MRKEYMNCKNNIGDENWSDVNEWEADKCF